MSIATGRVVEIIIIENNSWILVVDFIDINWSYNSVKIVIVKKKSVATGIVVVVEKVIAVEIMVKSKLW